MTNQPVVPLQLFSCTRGNNSLLGCYHATHGAAFSQSARFLSDWQAQAGSILRCRAARPPTPPNENLRSFGRHFPLVFEARGFRRYTFDHGSNVRPPNHFGQWVLVLYQFCTNVQLPSRPVHFNLTLDSEKMQPHKNPRDAANFAPPYQQQTAIAAASVPAAPWQQAPFSVRRNSAPTLPAAPQTSRRYVVLRTPSVTIVKLLINVPPIRNHRKQLKTITNSQF